MTTDQPRYRLVRSREYDEKRAKLTDEQLQQVELAERGIAENPDSLDGRLPSADGGFIDFTAADSGTLIKYRRDERPDHANEVELQDLMDEVRAARVRRWPLDSD